MQRSASGSVLPPLPVPGVMLNSQQLLTTSSMQSMFGPQVKSGRPTSSAYSFHRMSTGRERTAKAYDGVVVDPLYRGEEWNRHHIPGTPNPGKYAHATSLGRQALSQRRLAPSYGFGTSSRWGYQDRVEKVRRTPGPGQYVA